jgi:cell division protein FtsI/penicillin-binding protein 2
MKRALVLFVALLVVAGAIVGFALARTHADKVTLPSREVDTFLHAWSRSDATEMATLIDRPVPDLGRAASSLMLSVPGSAATYTRTGISGTADDATATYHAEITLKGLGPVTWDGTLALVHSKTSGWLITWNPAELYPGLAAAQYLTAKTVWPTRASIVAANGTLLAGSRSVVQIGLEPDHIKSPADLAAVKFSMQSMLGVDGATIDKILHAPGVRPNYFLPVIKVPRDANYAHIHETLLPIPGILFRDASGVSSADEALGPGILGTVGDITADALKKLGPPYKAGNQIGLNGLQAVYEKRLAGSPRTDVVIADAQGETVKLVKRFPGTPAQPVTLTIDPAIQKAAETALAGITKNAALVAIDTTTGGIRAVVSKPYGGFERALQGTYPPGSTFKVITTTALLLAGNTPTTPAPCPATITVDGEPFSNFEGEAPGAIDLATAFAKSCNNAFIGLADKLPANALPQAATMFGFNAKWSLGIDVRGGSYPTPRDGAERAASAIGQGRVLASPVEMASVAAAVASGRWRAPTLVTAPARTSSPVGPPLTPAVLTPLRNFMASVVRAGGTAADAGLPADSFGKTGTAEFGQGHPPPTHAWFIGYRGHLAYAVIVEGGGVGGAVAAPVAAAFLRALPK